jgi:hypothetical protein
MKPAPFTPEELDLLKTDTPIRTLASLPIFANRNIKAMSNKRRVLRSQEQSKNAKESRLIGYTGQRVKLYQFIKVEEATPERAKRWK